MRRAQQRRVLFEQDAVGGRERGERRRRVVHAVARLADQPPSQRPIRRRSARRLRQRRGCGLGAGEILLAQERLRQRDARVLIAWIAGERDLGVPLGGVEVMTAFERLRQRAVRGRVARRDPQRAPIGGHAGVGVAGDVFEIAEIAPAVDQPEFARAREGAPRAVDVVEPPQGHAQRVDDLRLVGRGLVGAFQMALRRRRIAAFECDQPQDLVGVRIERPAQNERPRQLLGGREIAARERGHRRLRQPRRLWIDRLHVPRAIS
jgi:hypothetical protein